MSYEPLAFLKQNKHSPHASWVAVPPPQSSPVADTPVPEAASLEKIYDGALGEPYPSIVMKPPGSAATHEVTPSVVAAAAGMQKMMDMGTISKSTISQFAQQLGVPWLEDETPVSAAFMQEIARQVELKARQPHPTESSKPKKKGKRTDEELTQIKMQLSALTQRVNMLVDSQRGVSARLEQVIGHVNVQLRQQEYLNQQQVAFTATLNSISQWYEQMFRQMMTLLEQLDADRQERAKRSPVDGFQAHLSRRKIRKKRQEQAEAGKEAADG